MSAIPKQSQLTLPEYFALEQDSDIRHEYYRGEVFAMAGASLQHITIAGNLFRALGNRLEDTSCTAYSNDMRLRISASGLYTYPDLSVACEEPQFDPEAPTATLLNPIVLVEVLSDSTEAYDRGDKARHYRQLESLREYVLVSQHEMRIEVHRWQQDGPWTISDYAGADAILDLPSLGCEIPLNEIYRRVEFEPPRPKEGLAAT